MPVTRNRENASGHSGSLPGKLEMLSESKRTTPGTVYWVMVSLAVWLAIPPTVTTTG